MTHPSLGALINQHEHMPHGSHNKGYRYNHDAAQLLSLENSVYKSLGLQERLS